MDDEISRDPHARASPTILCTRRNIRRSRPVYFLFDFLKELRCVVIRVSLRP
jgi:hypothetical protein